MRYGPEIISTLGVIVGGLVACAFLMLVWTAVMYVLFWAMRDAESRGKSGRLVALFVLLLQIPGLIAWLIFRPEKKNEHPGPGAP